MHLKDALKRVEKLLGMLHGQHDGVPATANVLGDFNEPSPVVLLQVEKEDLPFSNDFFTVQRGRTSRLLLLIITTKSKHAHLSSCCSGS